MTNSERRKEIGKLTETISKLEEEIGKCKDCQYLAHIQIAVGEGEEELFICKNSNNKRMYCGDFADSHGNSAYSVPSYPLTELGWYCDDFEEEDA